MFGSINKFGNAVRSKWETEDPDWYGLGANSRTRFDESAPAVSAPGTLAVNRGPDQTRLPSLVAEATRSADVMLAHNFPVLLSSRNLSHTLGNAPLLPAAKSPVSASVKVWNPKPWASSCRRTATKSIWVEPWLPSNPRYQPRFSRHPDVPMFMLNLALISGVVLGSVPDNALARALGYQVSGKGAFEKFRAKPVGPADPRVAVVAVQLSAAQLARTVIVGPLFSVAPQILAAAWKAIRRCWPRVVPLFPPTGAAGVESLNPLPAASLLRITILDCPDADEAATKLSPSVTRKIKNLARTCLIFFYYGWSVGRSGSSNFGSIPKKDAAARRLSTQDCEIVPSSFTRATVTF